jgi:hypothetical protein
MDLTVDDNSHRIMYFSSRNPFGFDGQMPRGSEPAAGKRTTKTRWSI